MTFLDNIKRRLLSSKNHVDERTHPDIPSQAELDDASYYAGRPMLMMMEAYVLDCIGHLPVERRRVAAEIVQKVWGGGDDWKATIRGATGLQDGIDEFFRATWDRNTEKARATNVSLSPQQYARMVVDTNFAHLCD